MRAYAVAFAILTVGFAGKACAQPYYNGVPLPPPSFQMPSGHSLYRGADVPNHGSRIPEYTAPDAMSIIHLPPPVPPPRFQIPSPPPTPRPLPTPGWADSTSPAYGHPPVVSSANAPPTMRHLFGIRLMTVSGETAERLHMGSPKGLFVIDVEQGDAASAAGIRAGDVLLTFAGVPVMTEADIRAALAYVGPHSTVTADIWRNGQAQSVSLEF
jgi:hypothetical protein